MIKKQVNTVQILDENENILLEQKYIADEFIWIIYNKQVIINKNENETFYDELNKIMNNNYIFQKNIPSSKTKEKLIWLSDQYCDLEDEESLSKINRLIIQKINDKFIIKIENPYLEKNNLLKNINIISFSPSGNGYYTKNLDTGLTLQDDISLIYQNLINLKQRILQ